MNCFQFSSKAGFLIPVDNNFENKSRLYHLSLNACSSILIYTNLTRIIIPSCLVCHSSHVSDANRLANMYLGKCTLSRRMKKRREIFIIFINTSKIIIPIFSDATTKHYLFFLFVCCCIHTIQFIPMTPI